MTEKSDAIESVLDRLDELADREDEASVGDAVETIGDRGWGPLVFVPALIEITPIGGIPGVPTLLALIIAIFAVQIAVSRDNVWLPGFLKNRSASDDKLHKSVDFLRPTARRLDRWFPGRWPGLAGDSATRIAALVCLVLCATVPPLELLPFAAAAPMAAIAVFGLAMTLDDGLLMVVGFAASAAALGFGGWLAL